MYAELIRQSAQQHIRAGQSDTSAADLQAVFGQVAGAVEIFENVTRGAVIHHGSGAPDNGLGLDIDIYIDTQNTDLYLKETGAWIFRLTLRGAPSQVPGPRGLQGPASTVAGPAGKSAYELAVASGYVGTLAQFLASLKGAPGGDGQDGTDGTRIRIESFAPTTELANQGDLWIHTISAAKYAIYDCLVNAQGDISYRLRFTSPDASAAPANNTGGGTVKSVNNVAPDSAGNVQLNLPSSSGVQVPPQAGNAGKVLGTDGSALQWVEKGAAGGAATPLEADLATNRQDAAPTVKAVKDAIDLYDPTFVDLVPALSLTINVAGKKVRNNSLNLNSDTTLTMLNVPNGATGTIIVRQDAPGGRVFTLPANSIPSGALAINSQPNGASLVGWIYTGTAFLWTVKPL